MNRLASRMLAQVAVASLLLVGFALPVNANGDPDLVFDNFDGPGAITMREGDNADTACGARVTMTRDRVITGIAIRTDLQEASGDIKFLIFDDGDDSLLLATGGKTFADDGMTWKRSDDFDPFTLMGGSDYNIGGIVSVDHHQSFDQVPNDSRGFRTTLQNPNWANYDNPTPIADGDPGADCAVRLYFTDTAPPSHEFTCDIPGSGAMAELTPGTAEPHRRGWLCSLVNNLSFEGQADTRFPTSECRFRIDADGDGRTTGADKLKRGDIVPIGAQILALCASDFSGTASVSLIETPMP